MTVGMTLQDLLPGLVPADAGAIRVSGLTLDSRQVRPGHAFVALQGGTTHGIEFAPMAWEQGAAVVLAELEAGEPVVSDGDHARARAETGPVVWIADLRRHLGAAADRFFGHPSTDLAVVGVTGTNGKTSTVQMLAQAWAMLGHHAASIGTLGAGLYGHLEAGERTTPDVISVHRQLAALRDAGATHVAMEVSSHALDQGRVDAVAFDVAVFTNLTRDHLDYHGTMQAYGEAKARLFAWPTLSAAVLNVDDDFGRELATRVAADVRCLRTGVATDDATVRAAQVSTTGAGLAFVLVTPWGEALVRSPLLGRFNVANLLAVAACLGALDTPFRTIVDVLGRLQPVPGRMSRLGGSDGRPLLVVDYAHTPDALEQALSSLRGHCAGRLTCVFGCGGERDAGKRPQMAAIAERLADRVVITDDNPRHEDGDAIVADILAGLERPADAVVQRDRARAIAMALEAAHAGDVVLVAGKGHEPYQDVAGVRHPFDDLAVARGLLEGAPC